MSHTESELTVGDCKIRYLTGGMGDPLLLLHHDTGSRGWGALHEQLSERFTVRAPDMPGYGGSDRLPWARTIRDLASVMQAFLDELDLPSTAAVGLGFGGWVAAEIAVQNHGRFDQMILSSPMGVRPRHGRGQISDQMLLGFDDYITDSFASSEARERIIGAESTREDRRGWNQARVTTARLAWKPYMWSYTLPHLLPLVKTPTAVLHGAANRIVPLDCSEQYAESIPRAELRVVDGVGHFIDLEQPGEIVAAVAEAAQVGT